MTKGNMEKYFSYNDMGEWILYIYIIVLIRTTSKLLK